jgi:hypothetical protein
MCWRNELCQLHAALEDDHISSHNCNVVKKPPGLAGVFLPAWLAPEVASSVVALPGSVAGNPCRRWSHNLRHVLFFPSRESRDRLHSVPSYQRSAPVRLTDTMSASLSQPHAAQSLRPELDPNAPLPFSKPVSRSTITLAELPDWMKDNEFILTGYRG